MTTQLGKGKVKFYNQDKNFGFVVSDETKQEIFFFSKLPLNSGDLVIFQTQEGKKGLEATSISKYEVEESYISRYEKVTPKKGRKCWKNTTYKGTLEKFMTHKNLRLTLSEVVLWDGKECANLQYHRDSISKKWEARKNAKAIFQEKQDSRTFIHQCGSGWDMEFMFIPEKSIYTLNQEAKDLGYVFLGGKMYRGGSEIHIEEHSSIGEQYNYKPCEDYFNISYVEDIEMKEDYIFKSTSIDYNEDHLDRGGRWASLAGSSTTTLEKAKAIIEHRVFTLVPKQGFEYLGVHTHKMSWAKRA